MFIVFNVLLYSDFNLFKLVAMVFPILAHLGHMAYTHAQTNT